MDRALRCPRHLPGLVLLLVAAGAQAQGVPEPPFEARLRQESQLVRAAPPPAEAEVLRVPAGLVVRVERLEEGGAGQGRMATVRPSAQSTWSVPLAHLEPLRPEALPSVEEAAGRLFRGVRASRRAGCQRFVQRLVVPGSDGREPTVIAWSSAADAVCAGRLALMWGTGKELRVRPLARRGPLHALSVHAARGGPPLLRMVESVRDRRSIGQRVVLMSLGSPRPKDLLAAELFLTELEGHQRHVISGSVTLAPAAHGLDIEVRRSATQTQADSATLALRTQQVRRYRYSGGRLVGGQAVLPPPEAPGEEDLSGARW